MKTYLPALIVALGLLGSASQAQLRPWPDSVTFYRQGPNAAPGFDSTNPYFPMNVLGPPDPTATGLVPSDIPEELQSLGTGGEIILKYSGRAIVDGPGPDFTVFGNPFFIGGDSNNVYRKVAIVSVSRDGVTFTEFPFQGAPVWHDLVGATPTLGGNPLDPRVSGGDKFDLAEIGVDSVHFVKIVDAAGRVADDGPSSNLDAVAALHLVALTTGVRDVAGSLPAGMILAQNYPNPFNPSTEISFSIPTAGLTTLKVYNNLGQEVSTLVNGQLQPGSYQVTLNATNLASGVYLYRLQAGSSISVRKMILLK